MGNQKNLEKPRDKNGRWRRVGVTPPHDNPAAGSPRSTLAWSTSTSDFPKNDTMSRDQRHAATYGDNYRTCPPELADAIHRHDHIAYTDSEGNAVFVFEGNTAFAYERDVDTKSLSSVDAAIERDQWKRTTGSAELTVRRDGRCILREEFSRRSGSDSESESETWIEEYETLDSSTAAEKIDSLFIGDDVFKEDMYSNWSDWD
jgi:hypothetical protein